MPVDPFEWALGERVAFVLKVRLADRPREDEWVLAEELETVLERRVVEPRVDERPARLTFEPHADRGDADLDRDPDLRAEEGLPGLVVIREEDRVDRRVVAEERLAAEERPVARERAAVRGLAARCRSEAELPRVAGREERGIAPDRFEPRMRVPEWVTDRALVVRRFELALGRLPWELACTPELRR